MRIHRILAEAVVTNLNTIFEENRVAERVVEKSFKNNPKWGKRDRAFIAEAVYDIVRRRRLLEAATGTTELWPLLGAHLVSREVELPEWPEFEALDGDAITAALAQGEWPRAVRESVPDWLDELGVQELGERWDTELAALNGPADVVLRVNTLKATRGALATKLAAEGIETEPIQDLPHALRLVERRPVTRTKLYQDGLFEVQDGGSQMIAPLLQVEPGQRVIDACAGAGGKSLHLAALLRNKGELLSLDVDEAKLEELKRRATRSGIKIVSTELIRQRVLSAMEAWADRLLLDVPCSGLGTLRRQPDLKWRLTPEFLEQIRGTQREILRTYTSMLKPGGLFVYSTCSILPSENEAQVQWLLETMGGHTLLEEHRVWPSETGFDGFYMALLRKD